MSEACTNTIAFGPIKYVTVTVVDRYGSERLLRFCLFTYLYTKIGFYKYKSIRFSLTILNLSIRVYKDEKANVIKITF